MREGREGQNKPKKNIATYRAVWEQGVVGTGRDAAKKQPGKKKQAVSKESEGGDSLLEKTENGRKVR